MDRFDLKAFRKSLSLTQSELSNLLDMDSGSISRMERGVMAIDKRTHLSMLWLTRDIDVVDSFDEQMSSYFPLGVVPSESDSIDKLDRREFRYTPTSRDLSPPSNSKRSKLRSLRKKKKKSKK